jgi:Uri superfamily endonuclease
VKGFHELEFDLPSALLRRLVEVFGEMDSAELLPEIVSGIPDEQGVYLLEHLGATVYVGKTDGASGLRQRLTRHCASIQHRRGLDPAAVHFKAIRIYVFTVVDLETELIKEFSGAEWNNSGFGSNDPGRERDTTKLKEDGFDAKFPIDIDRPLDLALPANQVAAADLLDALKEHVPYVLRFERHADLRAANVQIPPTANTARLVIESIIKQLPAGWQATALAGRIIMYRENRAYETSAVIARS